MISGAPTAHEVFLNVALSTWEELTSYRKERYQAESRVVCAMPPEILF